MVRRVLTKIGCLVVVLLVAAGCSSVDDEGASDDQDGEVSASLPGFETNEGGGDCEVEYNEKTIAEWIQAGDGLLIGTVENIEPALDIGWVMNPPDDFDEERLRDSDECDEMQYGFKIELNELEGYLHDSDLPEAKTMYFGYGSRSLFPTEARPDVDEDSVEWPDETQRIEEGMRIGGLVHKDVSETNRWSFLMSRVRPIFEVNNGDIKYQEMPDPNIAMCGDVTPFEETESLGESGLLNTIEEFDQEEVHIDREDRDWTEKPREEAANWVPHPWVAACHIEGLWDNYDEESENECMADADCEPPEVCTDGECIAE